MDCIKELSIMMTALALVLASMVVMIGLLSHLLGAVNI